MCLPDKQIRSGSGTRASVSRFHVFKLRILGHVPRLTGIGGIDCDMAVEGVHKVKPCSEGTSSHEER